MAYIKRDLEQVVSQLTQEYPVILITGPSQVGKNTMLQNLMQGSKRTYVSLEDYEARYLAKTDPELFLQIHKSPIFIDEVQYAPELFTYIKMIVDKEHEPGAFWLTSSHIFEAIKGEIKSLAGRVAILSLSPLSQSEIYGVGGATAKEFSLEFSQLVERSEHRIPVDTLGIFERIFKGAMPAVNNGSYGDNQAFYSRYVSSIIDTKVRGLLGTFDELKFFKFLTIVATRTSQLISVNDIAKEAEIHHSYAKNWLSILETLGIIFYLQPYSNSSLKRAIKTPKLYFYDTGLVCYLTKWSSAKTLECGVFNGAILENYVVSEIKKSFSNCAKTAYLYYYRDKDSKEIDLLIEHDGVINPIEIKKTSNPSSVLTKVFSVLDKSSTPRATGAVICMKPKLDAIDRQNYIIPIWCL